MIIIVVVVVVVVVVVLLLLLLSLLWLLLVVVDPRARETGQRASRPAGQTGGPRLALIALGSSAVIVAYWLTVIPGLPRQLPESSNHPPSMNSGLPLACVREKHNKESSNHTLRLVPDRLRRGRSSTSRTARATGGNNYNMYIHTYIYIYIYIYTYIAILSLSLYIYIYICTH